MSEKAAVVTFILALAIGSSMAGPGAQLAPLEIDYMLRGYFFAASPIRDPTALGGFGPSDNLPKRIDRQVPVGELSLIALPDEPAAYHRHAGFRVILVNDTGRRIAFSASDSRLSIVREAIDPSGQWKPVEYLPSSWCGNSYHRVFLPDGKLWSFVAPVYRGELETRMRFSLRIEEEQIYSNEFAGSINLDQFSVRQGHVAKNLMDPYID